MSPNSGDSEFNKFLKAGEPENLPTARKEYYNKVMIPLQNKLTTKPYLETVDTYLLALHWLLILDKVSNQPPKNDPIWLICSSTGVSFFLSGNTRVRTGEKILMATDSSSSKGIVLDISLSISYGVRNAAFYDLYENADIEVTQELYLDSLLKLSDNISKVSFTTLYSSHHYTDSYFRSYETMQTKRSKRCQIWWTPLGQDERTKLHFPRNQTNLSSKTICRC